MDIETTLNKCDFGEAIGDECHKLSYTRIQNTENLRDHSEDVQETLLMRAGIQHQPDKANMTICTHHSKKFGRVFERKFNKCCNIFHSHKVKAKGGHIITLHLAKQLRQKGLGATPGWQLCRNCFKKAQMNNQVFSLQRQMMKLTLITPKLNEIWQEMRQEMWRIPV